MRVLAGSGIESEAHLAFAALQQILHPVLDLVDRLPEPQAAALNGALGLSDSGTDRSGLRSGSPRSVRSSPTTSGRPRAAPLPLGPVSSTG
jgi:hypothetical protein